MQNKNNNSRRLIVPYKQYKPKILKGIFNHTGIHTHGTKILVSKLII